MKKKMVLVLGIVMTLSMAMVACGKDTSDPAQQESTSIPSEEESMVIGGDPATWGPGNNSGNVEIPSPFTDCESLEEAIKIAGFDFSVPDTVEGYSQKHIMAIENELVQILYTNEDNYSEMGDEELNNVNWEEMEFDLDDLLIRKAIGNEDVSGDYNDYAETNTVAVGDLQVTMKGNNGKINVAIWTNSEYTFAIVTRNAISSDEMTKLITNTK